VVLDPNFKRIVNLKRKFEIPTVCPNIAKSMMDAKREVRQPSPIAFIQRVPKPIPFFEENKNSNTEFQYLACSS